MGSRNWPLRGGKHSIWEGGTRGTALVHSPLISQPGRSYANLMHGADWLPTLVSAAGGNPNRLPRRSSVPIDGVDQWGSIAQMGPAVRSSVLYGRHDDAPNSTRDDGLRVNHTKLVRGSGGRPNSWCSPVDSDTSSCQKGPEVRPCCPQSDQHRAVRAHSTVCLHAFRCSLWPLHLPQHSQAQGEYMLFALDKDEEERHDLSSQQPGLVASLARALQQELATGVPTATPDKACGPATHPVDPVVGKVWAPWC